MYTYTEIWLDSEGVIPRTPSAPARRPLIAGPQSSGQALRMALARRLMPEMPDAGEHHGDPGVVGGFYHLIVADRSAGLDHRGGAGLDGDH